MSQYLVQVLLPTHRRNGTSVGPEEFARVRVELTERFGGVTAYSRSPATGVWKRDDEEVERDNVIMIEVVVEVFDREWWARYREQLETRFGQEEVLARAMAMERI
jgi:hypothetical protein